MKFNTTDELADAICILIDEFSECRLGELELYLYLKHIRLKNEILFYSNNSYNPELVRAIGKEKLELMENLLNGQYMT